MRFFRALAVITAVLSCLGTTAAQVIELRTAGDKTIACMHTGFTSGDLKDCGARSDSYAYVFVGSISAITSVENDEKEIQVVPEEIFYGKPATPLTVLTSQAACLPILAVGDRWLFFLRRDKDKPIILDYYGNDSIPVADAREQIETLRHLQNIGNFAIVRGQVMQGTVFDRKAIPDAQVIARRESDGTQFFCTSRADGRYEFEPLPPGRYEITVDPIGSLQPDKADIGVSRGACWDLTLSRSPHAQLGGHVRRPDGSPVPNVEVIIIGADDSWFITSEADARGYFTFDSLNPGEYVVGINLPGAPAWKVGGGAGVAPPSASLYYGGAAQRSGALVVKLAPDEKRDDLDFIVPLQ